MPRQQRPHVPGGTYYIVQKGTASGPIFSQPDDYSAFERVLPGVLRRADARVHAYCWTPQAIHLALHLIERLGVDGVFRLDDKGDGLMQGGQPLQREG